MQSYQVAGLTMFQFQTGAIKRGAFDVLVEYAIMFQFQTGAIKRQVPLRTAHLSGLFQFQTGAIKSSLSAPTMWTVKFQFQTGAIKSYETLAALTCETRFNSKLVRLKGKGSEVAL